MSRLKALSKYLLILLLGLSLVPFAPAKADGTDPVNLIQNPGFENGMTGWTMWEKGIWFTTSPVKEGTRSAKIISATQGKWVYLRQTVNLEPGKTYSYSSWQKVPAGKKINVSLFIYLDGVQGDASLQRNLPVDGDVTTDWQQVTFTFTIPSGATAPALITSIGYGDAQKAVYADDYGLYEGNLFGQTPVVIASGKNVKLTLTKDTKPLQLTYIGDNGRATSDFGNESKFWSDSLFNIARDFGGFSYQPSPGTKDVTDQASLVAATASIKANPEQNGYLDLSTIQSDLVSGLSQNAGYISAMQGCLEDKRLGVTTLKVTGPWSQIDPANTKALWNLWKSSYASAYLYAKNCGLTNFNIMNEPDAYIKDWSAYVNQLKLVADATRAGVKAAGLDATIWAPTYAGNNQTNLNFVAQNADDQIDVYDWHSYSASVDDTINRSNQYSNLIQTYNTDGQIEPKSESEFNYSLANGVGVNDFNQMSNVFKNMNLLKAQTDSGLFASIHFMFGRFTRGQVNQPDSGIFSVGLVSVDDPTHEMTIPTKMYYGFRMFARAVNTPGETVAYRAEDNVDSQQFEVTRHGNTYDILFMNQGANGANFTVDLNQLGIVQGSAVQREVSDQKNDEVVGNLPVQGGLVSTRVPAQSMTLLMVTPAIAQQAPAVPVIHRAFATTNGIELWWSNAADTSTFTVKRRSANGETATIADNLTNAFYTDTTAVPGIPYYYTVTGVTYGRESQPSAEVGPLELTSDPYLLPFSSSFESGSDQGWTQNSGTWTVEKSFEDTGYATTSQTGSQSVATVGSDKWDNYSLESRVYLTGLGADGKFGVLARYTDANNYYSFELDKATNAAVINKVQNGAKEQLASVSLDGKLDLFPSNYRYTINTSVDGGHLAFTIALQQGKQVSVEATDPNPLPQGKVGFVTENTVQAFFDGARVMPAFHDDFEAGFGPDWSGYANKWSIAKDANGHAWLEQTKRDAGKWEVAVNGSSEWGDLDLSAKIRPDNFSKKNATAVIFARYVDADNYYRYELTKDSELKVIKRVNGKETTLFTASCPVADGQVHTLEVRLDKNLQRVSVDGIQLGEFTDYEPALEHGKFAIGTYEAAASFDDVRVNP